MKTLSFTDSKRPLLIFEAETVSIEPEASAVGLTLLIEAEGAVTFQETPIIEEMIFGDFACLFTVTENHNTLLDSRAKVTLLSLEPDHLVARMTLDVA